MNAKRKAKAEELKKQGMKPKDAYEATKGIKGNRKTDKEKS